jgi:hypothetical protein
MPDLATALAGLYSGGDMTIFQATVDAVGQGVVTVHFNGGTFTDVPYLDMMITGHAWPSVGDACYVIGRKDWGMLVLGRPAPGPVRAGSDPVVALWEPVTVSSSFDIRLSLSLDWMARLRNGTAKGIYVRMPDFPMVLSGSGELRLTTL